MMLNRLIGIGVMVACACLAGCSGDQGIKISDANKDSVLTEIKDSRDFTADEVRLLTQRQARVRVASMVKATPPSWVGMTLRDAIADERKFEADAKAKEAEGERLAAEARAKADAIAAELRKAINLAVVSKSFKAANMSASEFEDYIVFKCVYENLSGKGIRAFRGSVQFADLFDKRIGGIALTIEDPIEAGKKGEWTGTIKYNQFNDMHTALRNAEMSNMKISWIPASIIFADGTQIGEK